MWNNTLSAMEGGYHFLSWKRKDVSTMIIDSSNVGMASSRTYSSAAVYQTETMNAKSEQAVLLDLSDESKTLMEQMKDIKNQQEEEKSQKQTTSGITLHMSENQAIPSGYWHLRPEDANGVMRKDFQMSAKFVIFAQNK